MTAWTLRPATIYSSACSRSFFWTSSFRKRKPSSWFSFASLTYAAVYLTPAPFSSFPSSFVSALPLLSFIGYFVSTYFSCAFLRSLLVYATKSSLGIPLSLQYSACVPLKIISPRQYFSMNVFPSISIAASTLSLKSDESKFFLLASNYSLTSKTLGLTLIFSSSPSFFAFVNTLALV